METKKVINPREKIMGALDDVERMPIDRKPPPRLISMPLWGLSTCDTKVHLRAFDTDARKLTSALTSFDTA
jgi:hypothetical protein